MSTPPNPFSPTDFKTPFVDPKTGILTPYWQRKFSHMLEGPSWTSDGEDLGLSSLLDSSAQSQDALTSELLLSGQSPSQQPPSIQPDSAFLIPERAWSTFRLIRDTRANRAGYPATEWTDCLFVETDAAHPLVYKSDGSTWTYVSGYWRDTLANLPGTLSTDDAGLLYFVTNYSHLLRWTGSAWEWGPGESGSGMSVMFEAAPSGFGADAWQIYDGSTVDRLNSDGTTSSVTLDNLGTAAYLKGGTSAAAVAAASGTVANTVATNQNESAHTHAVDPPSTASGAPSGTAEVQSGTGATVASSGHTHTTDIGPFSSGAGSAHTHTQDTHNHGPGSLELRNKQLRLYYRR